MIQITIFLIEIDSLQQYLLLLIVIEFSMINYLLKLK